MAYQAEKKNAPHAPEMARRAGQRLRRPCIPLRHRSSSLTLQEVFSAIAPPTDTSFKHMVEPLVANMCPIAAIGTLVSAYGDNVHGSVTSQHGPHPQPQIAQVCLQSQVTALALNLPPISTLCTHQNYICARSLGSQERVVLRRRSRSSPYRRRERVIDRARRRWCEWVGSSHPRLAERAPEWVWVWHLLHGVGKRIVGRRDLYEWIGGPPGWRC